MTARERVEDFLEQACEIASSRLDDWPVEYMVLIAQMLQAEDLFRRSGEEE